MMGEPDERIAQPDKGCSLATIVALNQQKPATINGQIIAIPRLCGCTAKIDSHPCEPIR